MKRLNPSDSRSAIDLTGKKFGRWLVLWLFGRTEKRMLLWWCRCECGTERAVTSQSLRNGTSKSCGCYNLEVRSTLKGLTQKYRPEYDCYRSMIRRCTELKNKAFHRYGKRGITVCQRWLDSFENFLEDMGPRPSKEHSIDRENNEGNYCKENCRWATKEMQANNTRTNRFITYKEETKTLAEWARHLKLDADALSDRIDRYHWTLDRAFQTPTRPRHRFLTYQGKTQDVTAWSKELKISASAIRNRIDRGAPIEEILSTEPLKYGSLAARNKK